MKQLLVLTRKKIFIFAAFIILLFSAFYSQNFRLDASSDTLILQNNKNFKYFNYYNNIFPTKNFLVLAIKSEKIIDIDYINKINVKPNNTINFNKNRSNNKIQINNKSNTNRSNKPNTNRSNKKRP